MNPLQETKCIYYIDEEETPYLVKLSVAPEKVTLRDFKNALNRPHSKFFFKSIDDDFGVVKEEIFDDNALLPCFNGRVISWLVTADESTISDSGDVIGQFKNCPNPPIPCTDAELIDDCFRCLKNEITKPVTQTMAVPADSTSTTLGTTGATGVQSGDTETESVHSTNQDHIAPLRNFHHYKYGQRYHLSTNGSHNQMMGEIKPASGSASGFRHHRHRHQLGLHTYDAPSSMISSDLESTSFFDSEDESSRFSSVTGTTMSSRRYGRARQRRRRRWPPPISRASSFSSITDSTMSLNILSVTLNMDTVNFLGISIVGQSNKTGDGGIYVGSIMKGGAVAQDGQIEPGDMILEVNGISFEEMSNDDAVRTLREQVQRPGPITLVVAKCWDPNPPAGYFTIPRQEPVRPIDPRAWVLHTNAMITPDTYTHTGTDSRGQVNGTSVTGASSGGESNSTLSPSGGQYLTPGMSMGTLTSGQTSLPLGTSAAAYNLAALLAASQQKQQQQQQQQQQNLQHQLLQQQQQQMQINQTAAFFPSSNTMLSHGFPQQLAPSVVTTSGSLPEIGRYSNPAILTICTSIPIVIRAMVQPDSGLDIRDRVWLKLTVPNAFIGSDLVDWLFRHLEGLNGRREARKYASNLLKLGYIRHIVNKMTFSEQCYYVFRDLAGRMSCLSLEEVDSVSEVGAPPISNWGHNTTSTSLTAGGPNGGPNQNEYNTNMIGLVTSVTDPCNHNGSQYSSVPSTGVGGIYNSDTGNHSSSSGLAAPIRQLIMDGQNATAAAIGIKSRMLEKNGNSISGCSTSSSSSSTSDSSCAFNQFNTDLVNNNVNPNTNNTITDNNNSNNNNNNNNSGNNLSKLRPNDSINPCFNSNKKSENLRQNQRLSQPFGPNPNLTNYQNRTQPQQSKKDFVQLSENTTTIASTTASSISVSAGDSIALGTCGVMSHKMSLPHHLHSHSQFHHYLIGQESSSKSSSSEHSSRHDCLTQQVSSDTRRIVQSGGSKQFQLISQPPPPPPRISTAAADFTLTNHPMN